ncbi:Glycoside hydrolase, 38 vacuolar alpha mannosidase [Coemansia sp. Benny D115]|nr:Glycoside hydrolase, 38 vacuolar alpha mannosidase [Coemansia sp. Benny D115]
MSYLQKHPSVTTSRLETFISKNQFKDVNIHASLYEARVSGPPHVNMSVWAAEGTERPIFEHAIKQEFKEIQAGHKFGPSWTTHWVRMELCIPDEFLGKEVCLYFDPSCEAMVWTANGEPMQGITGGGGGERRIHYILTPAANESELQSVLYLEVACNGLFGVGDYTIGPPDENRYFTLAAADLVVRQADAWALFHDLSILVGFIKSASKDSPRWWQALSTANAIVNSYDPNNKNTLKTGLEIAKGFFGSKNGDSAHQVYAIGNCHIDTAWLWPYDETKRKIARSWSTQIRLMDKFPEYRFAASQAQQFEWLRELYPELFKRVQEKIKTGQFIPIGGTWIEMDCNIPSGESLVRQFLLGQRFYEEHFGQRCEVFWLPDTFGYSSQLPQIVRQSGAKYFFTQKLSWNNINKFPHTTFNWVGLDGSRVLTHMAPAETYTANVKINELINSVKNHKDIAYSNDSLYLYGVGDGGGGPTEEMLERLERMKNVEGLPKIKHAHPNDFYHQVEKSTDGQLVSWKGELYFELHRGTYTSQAKTKKQNRQSELLLRDVEFLGVLANKLGSTSFAYPAKEIDRLWKLVCLNQFHDVIPGSSIEIVYKDSDEIYADVLGSARDMKESAIVSLYGHLAAKSADEATGLLVANTTMWPRTDIVAVQGSHMQQCSSQLRKHDQAALLAIEALPGCGIRVVDPASTSANANITSVKATVDANTVNVVLENARVSATIDGKGQLVSFVDKHSDRELVPQGQAGNVLRLHDDMPLFWDAWDIEIYNLEKYQTLSASSVTIVDEGPLIASVAIKIPVGEKSHMTQYVSLTATSARLEFACDVDWHENRKCLKTSFTWDIYSDQATYETQYGVVQRPTHRNTTWDMAKFEVCGHKFADLSEYGYGVALLNDSKYGYATLENTMSLTLLRSPKSPDANCDMGNQTFRYAVYPHKGSFGESDVVREAYQFNTPLVQLPVDLVAATKCQRVQSAVDSPYFSVTGAENVVLDAVKMAEDGSGDVVVRLYEAYGGHAKATVHTRISASGAVKSNIMEENNVADTLDLKTAEDGTASIAVSFKPFELVTLRLKC